MFGGELRNRPGVDALDLIHHENLPYSQNELLVVGDMLLSGSGVAGLIDTTSLIIAERQTGTG